MRNLAISGALKRRLTYENIARLSSAAAQINLEAEMTLEDVKNLHRLQSDFEKDPSNMQNTYELFSVRLFITYYPFLGVEQARKVQYCHQTFRQA